MLALWKNNPNLYNKFYYHHNFGHDGPERFFCLGINAKMSELQAAMGHAVLPYLDKIIDSRKRIVLVYREAFKNTTLKLLKHREHTECNYSYFPILCSSEALLKTIIETLSANGICPRRYFYPSLEQLPYVNSHHCEVSAFVSKRVLCLPLYHGLTNSQQNVIIDIIKKQL